MHLFKPYVMMKKVTDITIEMLNKLNAKLILLDVDNTLACHGSQEPFEGVVEWTYKVRESGVSIVIVSNNFKERVGPFAEKFNLPFVSLSLKPLPFGFNRAKRHFKVKPQNIVVIGDQVFTDVLGANLAGVKSILLEPGECEETLGIKFRRIIERPIREKIKNQGNNFME